MPLIIENHLSGELTLFPTESIEDFKIEAPVFLKQMAEWLPDDTIKRLERTALTLENQTFLTSAAIRKMGVKIIFDEKKLELHVSIPTDLRKPNVVYLTGIGTVTRVENALTPNPFSAYVNTLVGQSFGFHQAPYDNGRLPLRSDFETGINFKGTVLEATGSYTENGSPLWTRGDVRILKDFPQDLIRISAGDLNYPIIGYQQFRPLGGFTFASNFSLQPYRVTIPSNSRELILKSPSRVVVWLNGYRMQTLFLPAGKYDLRNVAPGVGINMIQLEVTDEVGRTQILTFPWISGSNLLAKGIHQYTYNIGFSSTLTGGNRTYDAQTPTVSAAHLIGISDTLTTGAYAQADHNVFIVGPEFLYASLAGTFSLEPALSRVPGNSPHYASKLQYQYIDYHGPQNTQRTATLMYEYREPKFVQLTNPLGNMVQAHDIEANYSQMLFAGIHGRIGATYQFNRKSMPGIVDSHEEDISFVKSWKNGIQLTLTLSDRVDQMGIRDKGVLLLASWAIPETNHYLTASSDNSNLHHIDRLDWRYNTTKLVGGYNAGAAVERAENYTRANANFNYNGNHETLGITHDITRYEADGSALATSLTTQLTSLHLGTSLVFAEGRFALARPVTDSFVIVAPIPHLKNQTIDVNPNGTEYYEARSDWLGPGVIPYMIGYQYYHLHVDPSKLDPGYELGKELFVLLPSYKSGFFLQVGTEATLMLSGTLVDDKSKPVELASGEVRSLDDPKFGSVILFTNRKGKFRVEGLKPGHYELQFFEETLAPIPFYIPEKAKGIYEVGIWQVHGVK